MGVFIGSFFEGKIGLINACLFTGMIWEFLRSLFGIK
jgi:hypothetical protein